MFSREVSKLPGNGHGKACAGGHSVQFYEHDSTLIDAVGQHFAPALAAGDTAIVVATSRHCRAIADELSGRGIDVNAVRASRHYVEMDAGDTLAKFMVRGWPDAEKFMAAVGRKIARAEALAQGRRVVVFGEMVVLLWEQGLHQATVRLEQLWNDFAERHSFFLLCGYPIKLFSDPEHRQMFFNICGEHTTVNSVGTIVSQTAANQDRRKIARVQQNALALEKEIRLTQERVLLLQKAAKAGTWELNFTTNTVSLSSAAAKLLKLSCGEVSLGAFLGQMYYSGDRDAVAAGLKHAYWNRRSFVERFRVKDGESGRLLEIRGKTFHHGGSQMMMGVLLDVTPCDAAA